MAEIFFKRNCHTRFAIFFSMPPMLTAEFATILSFLSNFSNLMKEL